VQVALHDLRRDRRGPQAELLADVGLDARRQMGAGAHAPEKLATAAVARAASSRCSARPNSSYISASFKPKVVGSAWMPWLRPIMGVSWYFFALAAMILRSALTSAIRMSADCTICTAKAVSTMSLLVRPKWSQRLAGAPMFSATLVVKAMTSWLSVRSSSLQRSTLKAAPALHLRKVFSRHQALSAQRFAGRAVLFGARSPACVVRSRFPA